MNNSSKKDYKLSEMASKEWKNFAAYVIASRAIPNMIDSFKPVQRFYLYSSIKNSPKDFEKVSAIGNVVSKYGYNHAETSCSAAGQLMASTWANNIPFIESRGSFGSRLVQKAGADRYTYTRIHENFYKYYKDIDLSPVHNDPEHEPPAYYIPIIPMVLVNGVKGIATGFATNIPPRDPIDLAKACEEYITTGKIKTDVKIKFPEFNGDIVKGEDGKTYCRGKFTKPSGKTTELLITEVPYGYDREGYINVLDVLEDRGDIVSYEDRCDKSGFKFFVKLKQMTSAKWSDEKIIKEFGLQTSVPENITVIDQFGKLRVYDHINDLIKDFCDFRIEFLQKRIDKSVNDLTAMNRWLMLKGKFIVGILNDNIKFKNKTRKDVVEQIKVVIEDVTDEECSRLLNLNILSLTKDMLDDLKNEIKINSEKLKYWKTTTKKDQFLEDLKTL